MEQSPLSIVTMANGEKFFIEESAAEVTKRVNDAETRLITLTRWYTSGHRAPTQWGTSGYRALVVRPGDVAKVEVNA